MALIGWAGVKDSLPSYLGGFATFEESVLVFPTGALASETNSGSYTTRQAFDNIAIFFGSTSPWATFAYALDFQPAGLNTAPLFTYDYLDYIGGVLFLKGDISVAYPGAPSGDYFAGGPTNPEGGAIFITALVDGLPADNYLWLSVQNDWDGANLWTVSWGSGPLPEGFFWTNRIGSEETNGA